MVPLAESRKVLDPRPQSPQEEEEAASRGHSRSGGTIPPRPQGGAGTVLQGTPQRVRAQDGSGDWALPAPLCLLQP